MMLSDISLPTRVRQRSGKFRIPERSLLGLKKPHKFHHQLICCGRLNPNNRSRETKDQLRWKVDACLNNVRNATLHKIFNDQPDYRHTRFTSTIAASTVVSTNVAPFHSKEIKMLVVPIGVATPRRITTGRASNLAQPLDGVRQWPFAITIVVPGSQFLYQGGTVRTVYAVGSSPFFTWLQLTGIDTGAPGRPRGDSGATAVAIRSFRI